MATSNKRTLYNKLEDCYNSVSKDYASFLFFSQDHQYKKNGEVRYCKKYFSIPIESNEITTIISTDNHLYELLPPGLPVHPYFDCEMTDIPFETYKQRLDAFLSFVDIVFQEEFGVVPFFVIFNSSTPKKMSYHVLVNNCYFENVKTHKGFIEHLWKKIASCSDVGILSYQFTNIAGTTETRYIFDKAPYGANQNFRFINQSKLGKNNPFIHTSTNTEEELDLNDILVRVMPDVIEDLQLLDASKFCVANGKIRFSEKLFSYTPTLETETEHDIDIDKTYNMIKDLIHYSCLNSCHMSYDERIKVGMSLRTMFKNDYNKGLSLYLMYRQKTMNHSNEYYANKFKSFNEESVCGMNLLIYHSRLVDSHITNVILKEYNPEKQYQLFPENTAGDVGLAKIVCLGLGSKSFCVDIKKDVFYQFTSEKLFIKTDSEHIRLLLESIILPAVVERENQILKIDDTDLDDEKQDKRRDILKQIHAIKSKVQLTGNRNNIIREVQCFLKINRETFEKQLDIKQNEVPISSGLVFNVLTNEFKERTIDDKWTFECPTTYTPTIESNLNQELFEYFNSLFCGRTDTLQVFIDVVKSAICGKPLRFIFFLIGEGRNGKSLLMKLISKVFSKFVDVISNEVIIDRKNKSNITTEFEKLEKVRIGYVTELKEEHTLDETNVKKISGGDPIDVRSLQQTNRTIIPNTTLFVPTNKFPSLPNDDALHDRLVCFPFNNRFEIDTEIENRILRPEMLSCCFSYIMNNGIVRSDFQFTDEMLLKRDEVIADNDTDYLKEFIQENCDHCEVVRTKGKSSVGVIKTTEFRQKYNLWLSTQKYPTDNSKSSNVFVRKLKKKGIVCENHHYSCVLGLKWKEEENNENL